MFGRRGLCVVPHTADMPYKERERESGGLAALIVCDQCDRTTSIFVFCCEGLVCCGTRTVAFLVRKHIYAKHVYGRPHGHDRKRV